MFGAVKLALAPYLIWIKLGLVAAVLGATVWGTWYVRSAVADRAERQAVEEAVKEIGEKLIAERKLRHAYQILADEKLEVLLKSISEIRITHTSITRNITLERELHKEFYAQPLPPVGFDEWKRARLMVSASPASAPLR